jgi:hypothetical protein
MNRYRLKLLLLAVVLMSVCYFGMQGGEVSPQELSFEAHPSVVVDAVWQQKSHTWTLHQGRIHSFPSHEIDQIKPLAISPLRLGLERLKLRFGQMRWQVFIYLNTHKTLGRDWPPFQIDLLLAAAGGGFSFALLFLLRTSAASRDDGHRSKKKPSQGGSGAADRVKTQRNSDFTPSPTVDGERAEISPQEMVVSFFLQLYSAQCAPGRLTQTSYSASGIEGPHGTKIYDLKVSDRGKVHRRRMSIGPLGAVGGGRSHCFFVIFDLHLVVKLPRTPITDYGHYIESIDKEREIATLLKGVPVIVPRVTTILEKVHRFAGHETLSMDEVEVRYIDWMKRNPAFQRYLKVGSSFAYFMALSSHHFLHHVLDDIHLIEARIRDEIRDNGHLIWEPHEFIGRYGAAAQPVCAQLQGVFQNCRRSLDLPTHPTNPAPVVTDFQHKQDFLTALADLVCAFGKVPLLSPAPSDMHGLVGEQTGVLRHYRRILQAYLCKTRFMQHRQQIGALVANTLDLTSWLHGRRIALRDLKPENLLVVGDKNEFPGFLKRRERFQFGLIDLETATARRGRDKAACLISAPKPGGTPLYATPSHFVSFELLGAIYPDPFEILLEQDWHAAIATCFRMTTGDHLWDGTAGLFAALVETLANADPGDAEHFAQLYGKLSWVFWSNARMEFLDKLRQHRANLGKVKLDLSRRCVQTIKKRIDGRIQALHEEMEHLLTDHANLQLVAHHLQLTDATSEQIRLLRTTWEMDATPDSKTAYRFSDRFRQLEGITQNIETLREGRELLTARDTGIALLPLLTIMFTHCLSMMYKSSWQGLGHRRIDWHEALMDEPSYTQTL